MMFVQRFALVLLVLGLVATAASAVGPNGGGVLVVHATNVTYTGEITDYTGQSGIWCGNDGPEPPQQQVCPPYDPYNGTIPCPAQPHLAANPTSSAAADTPFIWYVLAAFYQDCPRVKAMSFGIEYDESKMGIVAQGPSDPTNVFELTIPSSEDSEEWPASNSGTALSFSIVRTSRFPEIYWFATYAYSPNTNVTLNLKQAPVQGGKFVDDAVPPHEDDIHAYGILGMLGATGQNFPASPVDETSWGQIKAKYSDN